MFTMGPFYRNGWSQGELVGFQILPIFKFYIFMFEADIIDWIVYFILKCKNTTQRNIDHDK